MLDYNYLLGINILSFLARCNRPGFPRNTLQQYLPYWRQIAEKIESILLLNSRQKNRWNTLYLHWCSNQQDLTERWLDFYETDQEKAQWLQDMQWFVLGVRFIKQLLQTLELNISGSFFC